MKRTIQITFLFLIFSLQTMAEFVPENIARQVAHNFFVQQYQEQYQVNIKNLQDENTFTIRYHSAISYYIFNFNQYGFVQVAAEDGAYPILAYNLEQQYDSSTEADNYAEWMEMYNLQIEAIRTQNLKGSPETIKLWEELKAGNDLKISGNKSIEPLILSKWNQSSLYNALCPEDINGPGGRALVGCVAIAMSQIMNYYRYPTQGTGSHSYYHNTYGSQTANFGNTQYNWNAMTNHILPGGNIDMAELLYQVGVSVDMNYGASSSGAYSFDAASALRNYFGYQSSLSLKNKSSYSYSQWVSMITTNLDNGIPLYYHGYDYQNGGGHAFNLDGYQGSDHFHFNWGWGGSYDGYFYLSALNPGTNNFIDGQGAIFDIYPATAYPFSCTTNSVLTSLNGTIHDGSGPSMYENNLQCNWLIQPPQNIDYIKLSFDRFSLGNNDTLFIYDGINSSDSLLIALTGGQTPADIYSTGGSIFIEFRTDATNIAEGFAISYKSYFPIYCNGNQLLSDSTSSITDGSGTNLYNNASFCRWQIEPSNGYPIRLIFDSFDTELGEDFVRVYDVSTTPSVLLASYSGNTIPQSVVCNSGKMMVIFTSNSDQNFGGWDAHYITGPSVGIEENTKLNSFYIYPNPTKNLLNIVLKENFKDAKLQLFSMQGQLLIQKQITQKEFKLDVSALSIGIYQLRIITDNQLDTRAIEIIR